MPSKTSIQSLPNQIIVLVQFQFHGSFTKHVIDMSVS
jgi:hypothetical protein